MDKKSQDLLKLIYDKSILLQKITTHHMNNVSSSTTSITYDGLGDCEFFKIVSTTGIPYGEFDINTHYAREETAKSIAREFERTKIKAYDDSDDIKSLVHAFTRNHAIFCNNGHYAWLLQNWVNLNIQLIQSYQFSLFQQIIAKDAIAFLGAWPVYIIETESAYLVNLHRSAIINAGIGTGYINHVADDYVQIDTVFSGFVHIGAIKLNQFNN